MSLHNGFSANGNGVLNGFSPENRVFVRCRDTLRERANMTDVAVANELGGTEGKRREGRHQSRRACGLPHPGKREFAAC